MTRKSFPELKAAQKRICDLMGWEPHSSHKFEIIRRSMDGGAILISVEKLNQIADRLEWLGKSESMRRDELAARSLG